MFGYFVDGPAGLQQVGLFIGALACLGLGGLILGNSLYWRLHAPRVSGTIMGVVVRGGMYTPVYRYSSPDGLTHQARSNTSSGAIRGKETGRVVPLMISPHNPAEAQEANSYLFDAIGVLLFATGAFLGYTAITAYPVTWMTWLMAGLMLATLAGHGHRLLIPKGPRPSYAEWRSRRAAAVAIDPAEITPIEKLILTPEAQAKLQLQSGSNRKAAPLVAAFAAILLAVGVYQARDIARLESAGLRAQGQVVRLKSESGSGSIGHYSYYPIVRFRTDKNLTVEFKDSVGTNPPSHRPGDKVAVLYNADDPRRDAIIDRGLFWNWAIPGVLLLAAALLGWLFALMIADRRRAGPEDATHPVAAGHG
jgi:Protein of unknown function (DUF3592)